MVFFNNEHASKQRNKLIRDKIFENISPCVLKYSLIIFD